MNNLPPMQVSAARAGTQWENIVPSSENINYTPETDWADFSYEVNDDDVENIAGVPAMGMAVQSTNEILRNTNNTVPDAIDNNILAAAYVKPVLALGNTWCSITVSATDNLGQAHGVTRFFDLAAGTAEGSVVTNSGASINYGIEAVDNGFLIWQLNNCGGDATNGVTFGFRPLSSGAINTGVNTGDATGIYITGMMSIIGPTGLVNYVPTDDVA